MNEAKLNVLSFIYNILELERVCAYIYLVIVMELGLHKSALLQLHLHSRLKEARYKIIQNDRFSWKNHVRTYRYDDSKYTKMILGYHATFFATCIWKLHEIQFWPQICIHTCLKAWYIQLTSKNCPLSNANYFICITGILHLIATDNFHFRTSVKCRRHSKYFHRSPHFGK